MYTAKKIKSLYSAWRAFYQENDRIGEELSNFVYGDQWNQDDVDNRNLRGEESIVFNLTAKQLDRVKGEVLALDLGLQVKANPNTVDPLLLKEGKEVLEKIILCNDHMKEFQTVLGQVFDYGYGAMLVSTKLYKEGEPSEIPYIKCIKNLKKCFWDVESESENKTDGRHCGVRYFVDACEFQDKKLSQYERRDKIEVIDFWFRHKTLVDWYYTQEGKWVKEKPKKFLTHKKIPKYQVKFMRVADDKVVLEPIDYYTQGKLPLIYWKGREIDIKSNGSNYVPRTIPFAFNLVCNQLLINAAGSGILSSVKRLGSSKAIVTDAMIQGKENFWDDFNRSSGVLRINEDENGQLPQPLIVPPEQIDGSLINIFQQSMQMMDVLAGATPSQSGDQGSPSSSGLRRQIMQSNIMQNTIKNNHLLAINEVGKVLKQMTPNVIIEERDIGGGFVVNKKGPLNTPSNPEIINSIDELFGKLDFEITYSSSSEAQKADNLIALKEFISMNPTLAPYFADEFVENLNTSNSDVLKRRVRALMPPGIEAVGNGTMTLDEYRQQQEQMQQAQQQQPNLDQQELELEKQKIEGEQALRQEEINIKKQKLQTQFAKDSKNLEIKEASALSKIRNTNANH